jgi:ferrochelatase
MNAVLLLNVGSPDSPDVSDVRRYLAQFLMDPYVLDMPYLLRAAVVYGTILPKRPANSARAYRRIWMPEGSPLLVYTGRFARALEADTGIPVGFGMRYGNPSIPDAIAELKKRVPNLNRLLVIPMYPQYAQSSYKTAVEEVKKAVIGSSIAWDVLPPFFNRTDYISVLAAHIGQELLSPVDHYVFTFHGLPVRHIKKADPTGRHCQLNDSCCSASGAAIATCYRAQSIQTARLLQAALGLPDDKVSIAFQSRLGREPWLEPFTEDCLIDLARQGVKRVAVISPSFVADCLETLEEIGMRAKSVFVHHGGEDLFLVSALNADPQWVHAVGKWIAGYLK